jgi:xylulokinase
MWVRDEMPELFDSASFVVDVQGFLVRALTGEWATSVATAESLGLVDFDEGAWSDEILSLLGLPAARLPRLAQPGDIVGRLSADAAAACGLSGGLPVVAGAGDGQAGLLGAGAVGDDQVCVGLGTSLACGALVAGRRDSGALRSLLGPLPGYSVLESLLRTGAFAKEWLGRLLGDEAGPRSFRQLDELAARAPAGSDGVLCVPYFEGQETPGWDADARALVYGLRGSHGPEVVARAVLEGVALELRLHVSLIGQALDRHFHEVFGIGGGFAGSTWSQIISDVLGTPVKRKPTEEATARGAAVLAAAASGWGDGGSVSWRGLALSRGFASTGDEVVPDPARHQRYDALFEVYTRLYSSVAWAGSELARMDLG